MNVSNMLPEYRKRLFDRMREEVGPSETRCLNVCKKCKRGFWATFKRESICPKCSEPPTP